VIIHDLDIVCVPFAPNEADTPLVVDPDAVLPLSVAVQGFQAISRRRYQVSQFRRAVQLPKLPARNMLDSPKTSAWQPMVKSPCFRGAERLDHKTHLMMDGV
jgi:hypothetical protein